MLETQFFEIGLNAGTRNAAERILTMRDRAR
jgi:hypothetical protein